MRRFLTFMLMLLLCIPSALADTGTTSCLDTPPDEVVSRLAAKRPGYALEDYIRISGTSKGDFGLALIAKNGERELISYKLGKNGKVTYWLSTKAAVPQGTNTTYFQRHSTDVLFFDTEKRMYRNDLGFTVAQLDSEHEYVEVQTSFHWQKDANDFLLTEYQDWTRNTNIVYVSDKSLRFVDFGDGSAITVKGSVQRSLRYVTLSALPTTAKAAETKLTASPDIPDGDLTAQKIKFTGGKKYPVYSAPDDASLRGGNGKAIVSTNDWIQVFGRDGDYILIQYGIQKGHMRFGYIDAKALPKDAKVDTLQWRNTSAWLNRQTTFTDDPLYSKSALLTLPQGCGVRLLAVMGEWAYVESDSGDLLRGFVPLSNLDLDETFDLVNQSEGAAQGTAVLSADRTLTVDMVLVRGTQVPSYALTVETADKTILLGQMPLVNGHYQGQFSLPAEATSINFVAVDSDGRYHDKPTFSIQW